MAETIKGLNIKLGLDATELNEKLGKVKTDLKEQQSLNTTLLMLMHGKKNKLS